MALVSKNRSPSLIFCSLIFAAQLGFAQSQSATLPAEKISSPLGLTDPTKIFTGSVRFEGMHYLSTLPESPQLTESQFMSAGFYYSSPFSRDSAYSFASDAQAGTFFIRSKSNYLVKELYIEKRWSEVEKMYLGRKRFVWSEIDRYWLLGVWQPNYAIDLLRPEEQGLFGAFYNHEYDMFSFVGFASPVFIPAIGPDIREEGGALVSDSRWYRRPSSSYNFNDRINSISYKLNVPQIIDLASQPSVGVTGRWGDPNGGVWVRSGLGFKPMNELSLKRQNFKVIDQDQIDVRVSPRVSMHSLFSFDTGYQSSVFKTSVSYIEDNPKKNVPEEDWSTQWPQAMRGYSALASLNLQKWTHRNITLDFGYLKIYGGKIIDINSEQQADTITLFDERFKFKDAISFKVDASLFQAYRRPLITKFSYLYDFEQKGTLLGTELQFFPVQNWSALIGIDALGVQEENSSSRFLNQYRANDRYYAGVGYVF